MLPFYTFFIRVSGSKDEKYTKKYKKIQNYNKSIYVHYFH